MARGSFDDPNSIEASQFLLDRKCERNHPKRHRTKARQMRKSKAKRSKERHRRVVAKVQRRKFLTAARAYWNGEADGHP